jgi:hypothetical protein
MFGIMENQLVLAFYCLLLIPCCAILHLLKQPPVVIVLYALIIAACGVWLPGLGERLLIITALGGGCYLYGQWEDRRRAAKR